MQKLAVNIKKSIPYGGQKEIAKILKVSVYTVNRALNGGICTPFLQAGIAEYLQDIASKKQHHTQTIQQAIATLQS